MKLNKRLMMIAEKIHNCEVLADIGTDHGYIPIFAIDKGLCRKAIATDLRKGPLEIAAANVKSSGLSKRIEIRQGDGLGPLALSECDTVIIAGMGGQLIRDILEVSPDKAQKAEILLLQPNTAVHILRRWLYENGYDIIDENLTIDAGKFYCLIAARWTGRVIEKDDLVYYLGERLLTSDNPFLRDYLVKKIRELDKIIDGRGRSKILKSISYSVNPAAGRASCERAMDTDTCIYIRDSLQRLLSEGQVSSLRESGDA